MLIFGRKELGPPWTRADVSMGRPGEGRVARWDEWMIVGDAGVREKIFANLFLLAHEPCE